MGLKVCPFLDTEGKDSKFVISSGRSMNLENNIKTTKIGGMSKLNSCLNLTDKAYRGDSDTFKLIHCFSLCCNLK